MLTRRDNLLIRPWQERRYIHHRIKVASALPVIDNHPPPYRQHVSCKMKKIQKEKERCSQIVSDNFTLLQHLGHITRTTRVDNAWDEPPPNFLNRVGIYPCRKKSYGSVTDNELEMFGEPKNRKERCLGCSPQRYVVKIQIPEERIPFPPPKKRISRKLQSPPAVFSKEAWEETTGERGVREERRAEGRKVDPARDCRADKEAVRRRARRALSEQTQSLLLTRGALTLRVLFPPDSGLVFRDKGQAKVLHRQICACLPRPSPSA